LVTETQSAANKSFDYSHSHSSTVSKVITLSFRLNISFL